MYKVRCNSATRTALALEAVKNSVVAHIYEEEMSLCPYLSSNPTLQLKPLALYFNDEIRPKLK
jgi:hypothetical protein